MIPIITYIGTIGVAAYILLGPKNYANGVILLAAVSLWNIPIYMAGNSLAAGIFPSDVVLLALMARYLFGQRTVLHNVTGVAVYITLFVLVGYVLLRACGAVLLEDYGYYNRFVIYGAIRWIIFAALFIVFSRRVSPVEINRSLAVLGKVLLIYNVFAIVHQMGIIDLSGAGYTGHAELYERWWLSSFVMRTFLGNNSASTAYVASIGVFIAIYLYSLEQRSIWLYALGGSSVIALAGTYSRTDLISLTVTLMIGVLLMRRNGLGRSIRKYMAIPLFIVMLSALSYIVASGTDVRDIGVVQRYFGTDYLGEYRGETQGTLSYRMDSWKAAIGYIQDHPLVALFGFGPNGYRMFLQNGIGELNYGHNIYLHTIGELGVVGFLLIAFWITGMFRLAIYVNRSRTRSIRMFGYCYIMILIQRLLSGLTVDTLFATDNANTVNVLFIMFSGYLVALAQQRNVWRDLDS